MTRRRIAVACMAAGVSSATAGASIAFGFAVGLLALGSLLVGLGVLLGWDG